MRTIFAVVLVIGVWAVSTSAATVVVDTVGFSFSPADVTINQGDTVVWQLYGHHTTTSDDGLWDSGFGPFSYAHTFGAAGDFRYYCVPHGGRGGVGMSGIIRVTGTKTPTVTMLESSVNPSTVGQEVMFTASVSPDLPTGTVTFTAEGTLLCSSVPMTGATATCSTSSLAAGTHSIVASYSGDEAFQPSVSDPLSQTVSAPDPPLAPAMFGATAISGTEVTLVWSMSTGATGYEVYRTTNRLNAYQLAVSTTGALTATDVMRMPDTTYLYKVRAINAGGPSPFSAIDAATTTVFTDPELPGIIVKAVHVSEMQTAVNAMRAAAALGSMIFTDAPIGVGTPVRAMHIDELRGALEAARAAIGLPPVVWTDGNLMPGSTVVKAIHGTELRDGTR